LDTRTDDVPETLVKSEYLRIEKENQAFGNLAKQMIALINKIFV